MGQIRVGKPAAMLKRVLVGLGAAALAAMLVKETPALVREIKIERM